MADDYQPTLEKHHAFLQVWEQLVAEQNDRLINGSGGPEPIGLLNTKKKSLINIERVRLAVAQRLWQLRHGHQ